MVEMIELCLRQSLKVSSYKSRKLTHLGGRVCGQGLKRCFIEMNGLIEKIPTR